MGIAVIVAISSPNAAVLIDRDGPLTGNKETCSQLIGSKCNSYFGAPSSRAYPDRAVCWKYSYAADR
jgi:hypothetical protein